jgi:putative lipoprotein
VRADDRDPWFGRDKLLHFGVSAGLAGGSYAGATLFLDARWQRAAVAVSFTLSLGAAKEVWDALGHGDPSLRDFSWDVIGCAIGIGVAYVVDLLLSPSRDRPEAAKLQMRPRPLEQ